MFYADVPLLHGCVDITTIVTLEWALSRASLRHARLERGVTGVPVAVIRDGRVFEEALRNERVSREDLRELLRMRGVPSLDQVECAVLEDSGNLSVLVKGERPPADPELWSRGVQDRAGTERVDARPGPK
jgi:uncharacterized membrane protein YcaP (DUF421 family)